MTIKRKKTYTSGSDGGAGNAGMLVRDDEVKLIVPGSRNNDVMDVRDIEEDAGPEGILLNAKYTVNDDVEVKSIRTRGKVHGVAWNKEAKSFLYHVKLVGADGVESGEALAAEGDLKTRRSKAMKSTKTATKLDSLRASLRSLAANTAKGEDGEEACRSLLGAVRSELDEGGLTLKYTRAYQKIAGALGAAIHLRKSAAIGTKHGRKQMLTPILAALGYAEKTLGVKSHPRVTKSMQQYATARKSALKSGRPIKRLNG